MAFEVGHHVPADNVLQELATHTGEGDRAVV